MTAYYNENDPSAAQWLRYLIRSGLIAPGDVDERSIEDVRPSDLVGYTQHHFFAGIGGWSYALRLSGWSDDRPAWTGSCPCQPFSSAGNKRGENDPRHLWPSWRWLIDQHRPAVIFGEQVAGVGGRNWFAGVRTDMEALDYAVGGADLCAAGVKAPHIRQRLYWVAHTNGSRPQGSGATGQLEQRRSQIKIARGRGAWDDWAYIECADAKLRRIEPGTLPMAYGLPGRVELLTGYGNSISPQLGAAFVQAYMETSR